MNEQYKIYLHIFPNNKVYVGLTKLKVNNRWRFGKGYKSQYIYRAINKYGWNNIKNIVIFDNLDFETAQKIEINLIKIFKSNNKIFGYNIECGGQLGMVGVKRSEITIEKMRKANIGKIVSSETKQKISNSNKGRIVTEEMKKKMSEKQMGNKNHNFGKKATLETRLKMIKNQKRGLENKNHTQVEQFDLELNFIKRWDCINDACKEYKVGHSSISDCCSGKQKTSKGFIWKYSQ